MRTPHNNTQHPELSCPIQSIGTRVIHTQPNYSVMRVIRKLEQGEGHPLQPPSGPVGVAVMQPVQPTCTHLFPGEHAQSVGHLGHVRTTWMEN